MTESIEVARAESERGELVLKRRRSDRGRESLELRSNGVFVMDTLNTATEIQLASLALDLVGQPRRVVVGGLGLGYTLQAVLADPRVEQVAVVEIEAALIGWMRDGTIPHGPAILADKRLKVVNADILMAIAEAKEAYDLVLLDVDNGPGYLVHQGNAGIYEHDAVAQIKAMVNPGGALVVWSASQAPELQRVLEKVFGQATEHSYDVLLDERPDHYYLYCAVNR